MDNYATHKTAAVKAWLARRVHWHIHFTPTPTSWINQVERWFAELTRKQLQRGVHHSTRQLEADIRAFIDKHNEDPKPFKWTKSADDILAAVKRFCLRVEKNLCHELGVDCVPKMASGSILHVVCVCINRIGTPQCIPNGSFCQVEYVIPSALTVSRPSWMVGGTALARLPSTSSVVRPVGSTPIGTVTY